MAVRTARLGQLVGVLPGPANVVFSVPAGETWLVKRITAVLPLGLTTTLRWELVTAGGVFPLMRVEVSDGHMDREVWWVAEPGENFRVDNEGLNAVDVTVHGAELLGVA